MPVTDGKGYSPPFRDFFFSSSPQITLCDIYFFVDRVSLFDSIEPRPVFAAEEIQPRPINEVTLPVIVAPECCAPCAHPAQEIAETAITAQQVAPVTSELNGEVRGKNKSDVLLQAIRIVAKKEPTFVNECALRDLVRKYAHQFSLDF
jgi:hypothetical protein